jgi:hypothetical protein
MPFKEMQAALGEFDAGRSSFRQLLDRLEQCADALGDEDAAWSEAFRRQWGRLEDAYAYAAFKGLKTIPERDMPEMETALNEAKRLVAEKSPAGA